MDVNLTKILDRNIQNEALLEKLVKGEINKKEYKKQAKEYTGQWCWGETSYNIRASGIGCKHQCKYCYVGPLENRYGRENKPVDIEALFPLDEDKVEKNWRKSNDPKVYFFPSTHDIFFENVKSYVSVCEKIINAGHSVMFVTKPTIRMINEFISNVNASQYKAKLISSMSIFITITTNKNNLLQQFEPLASKYEERVECLKLLYDAGFNTGIMCEPFLSDPCEYIFDLQKYIRYAITIGPMNYSANCIFDANPDENVKWHNYIKSLNTPENMLKILKTIISKNKTVPFTLKKDGMKLILENY